MLDVEMDKDLNILIAVPAEENAAPKCSYSTRFLRLFWKTSQSSPAKAKVANSEVKDVEVKDVEVGGATAAQSSPDPPDLPTLEADADSDNDDQLEDGSEDSLFAYATHVMSKKSEDDPKHILEKLRIAREKFASERDSSTQKNQVPQNIL